jgi:catechol 2,3-dioxygenase-like lactoylglutathione lyase family enzyme
MIKGAHHVAISVTNLQRAIGFYTELLGMEIAAATFPLNGPLLEEVTGLPDLQAQLCVVRKGSLMLELFEFAHPQPAPKDPHYPLSNHGITHFGIEVTDIDALYERLVAAGTKFHSPVRTFPRGIRATYGRDPDGNVFELLQMPQATPA